MQHTLRQRKIRYQAVLEDTQVLMCQYVLYKVKCSIKQNLIIIVNSQCFETFILIFLEFILARPRGKLELFADSFVN